MTTTPFVTMNKLRAASERAVPPAGVDRWFTVLRRPETRSTIAATQRLPRV